MAPPKIVILVLENRSFDEYFGMRTDAVGFHDHSHNAAAFSQPGWSEELPTIQPFRASTFSTTEGFGEEYGVFWDPQHLAWNYGAMNGWSIQNNEAGGDATAMSYLAPNDIPYHWTLGETFLLCDTYFCSVMSSTFPNRIMLMSGSVFDPSQLSGTKHIIKWEFPNTNVPVVDNVAGNDLIFNWPSYPNTIGTTRSWAIYDDQSWQPNWIAWNNPEPAQPALAGNPQLPAYLAWKDGTGTASWPSWTPPALNVLDYLDGPVPGNTSLNTTSLGHTGDTSTYTLPNGHVGTYYSPAAPAPPSPMPVTSDPPGPLDDVSNFETDALGGNLPDVSWLIPPIFACDHPTRSMPADNELYMARIVHAVTNSPHWDKEGVVLLVTYDENDGRFDHVRPPASMSDRLQAYGHQGPDTIAPLPTPILGGAGIEPPMPHKPKKPPLGTPWEPWIDGLGTETGSTAYSVIGPAGGGFRVPTVIISPWTFGKQVSSRVAPGLEFDHTSIIQYLEEITGVTCPNLPADTAPTPSKPMGGWRRATFASLGKLIDDQRPRASTAEVNAALGTAYNNVDAWRLDALTRLYGQTPASTSQSPPTRPVLRSPGPSPAQAFPPVPQRCRLTIKTSTFDVDEIRERSEAANGVGHPNGPVTFNDAFSVVVDGFEPAEVDLGPRVPLHPGQTPPPGQVPPLLPGAIPHSVKATITLDGHPVPKIQVGGSLVDPVTATVHPVAVPQDSSLGDVAQSFRFVGDIHFPAGAAVFDPEAHIVGGGSITLRLRADFTSRLTFESPEEHIHLVGPPTHSSTGKIVQLSFDRFGDFEGFVVETGASHHVRFDSRKAEVADLVRWAWKDGIWVTVYSRPPHHREPERIVLHAPG